VMMYNHHAATIAPKGTRVPWLRQGRRARLQTVEGAQPDTPPPHAARLREVVGYYECRVVVEEYHKCQKTGVGIELLQLQSRAGLEPLIGLQSMIGILKDAPHPNAARVLEEFVLSPEGQKVMADNDYLPADPDVAARIADLKPEAGHFKANLIPPQMVHDDLLQWRAVFHEVFR